MDNMSPSIVHDKVERFSDISTMLTFWETQEDEESTPIPERVRERRRRSAKLEQLVSVMGLESKAEVDPKVTPKGRQCQSEDNNIKLFLFQDQQLATIYLGENIENKGFGVEISLKRKRESSLTRKHKKWRGFGPTA